MTVPTPLSRNAQFWSVLRHGQHSPLAHWFDIDWFTNEHHLLLPVLGAPLEAVLARGELTRGRGGPSGAEEVLRYYEHEFPLRPGTEHLPLPHILDAQPYRLAHWRAGEDGLNYRRFFDVTTLAGIRVEEPDVFFRTHALLLDLVDAGVLSGLRIDHPDGLADPADYLARLARATGDVWVVAEKILEGEEDLPQAWRCAGTTGYDALGRIGALFLDPEAAAPLTRTYAAFAASPTILTEVVATAKTDVVAEVLEAEVGRLVRLLAWLLPQADPAALQRVLSALLVSMDRYRIYVPAGGEADEAARAALDAAGARAAVHLDGDDAGLLAGVLALVGGRTAEGTRPDSAEAIADVVTRFQQTCGPVMAKGVEDTAFYRYQRLLATNEVGGDPDRIGLSPSDFHAYCTDRLARWPVTMTTLSTHDTKRSEDVRARQAVLSERPQEWADWVEHAHTVAAPHRDPRVDRDTEYRLWQELIGAWPIDAGRFSAYAHKAIKEAKRHTTWIAPDPDYEAAIDTFATGVTQDPAIAAHVTDWLTRTGPAIRANVLGQKVIQLTMPGVADSYQGAEGLDLSLVDPDNRRAVDFAGRAAALDRLDAGHAPATLDEEKLRLTSAILRLRRDEPECFVGVTATYTQLATTSDHLVAFNRGDDRGPRVVVLVTRLADRLRSAGGWSRARLDLPEGTWRDLLTGAEVPGGTRDVADLLGPDPVAVLVRAG